MFIKAVRSGAMKEPWRNSFGVEFIKRDGRLIVSLIALTPLFALLAAYSRLRQINTIVRTIGMDIAQIEITSIPLLSGNEDYAPCISWKVNTRDRRLKTVHNRHVFKLYEFLWRKSRREQLDCQFQPGAAACYESVFLDAEVQEEAIDRLYDHIHTHGLASCGEESAKRQVTAHVEKHQHLLQPSGFITRYTVIRCLRELDLVHESRENNPPLCPWTECANMQDIVALVELSTNLAPGGLLGKSRKLEAIYARRTGMNIMRLTTCRNLQQIGSAIGGLHHSTVLYGLAQSAAYRDINPMHASLINMFCQIADNEAIFRGIALKKSLLIS